MSMDIPDVELDLSRQTSKAVELVVWSYIPIDWLIFRSGLLRSYSVWVTHGFGTCIGQSLARL